MYQEEPTTAFTGSVARTTNCRRMGVPGLSAQTLFARTFPGRAVLITSLAMAERSRRPSPLRCGPATPQFMFQLGIGKKGNNSGRKDCSFKKATDSIAHGSCM